MELIYGIIFLAPVVAIAFAIFLTTQILKKPQGTEKMKHIAKAIQDGAMAFFTY